MPDHSKAPEKEQAREAGRILGNAMAYLNEQTPRNGAAVEILNKAWGSCFKDYVFAPAPEAQTAAVPALPEKRGITGWCIDHKHTHCDVGSCACMCHEIVSLTAALQSANERAERAEKERDGLLHALGWLPGSLDRCKDIILEDAAALRPEMVKARRAQQEAEGDAMLMRLFIEESRGDGSRGLLVKVWDAKRKAEDKVADLTARLSALSGSIPAAAGDE